MKFYEDLMLFSEVAEKIVQLAKEEKFLIGGELGAALATSYLFPQKVTLHIADSYSVIADELGLKPSPQREITFLAQFGNQNNGSYKQEEYIANLLFIHAELMLETDERLEETAELIFTKYIEGQQYDE